MASSACNRRAVLPEVALITIDATGEHDAVPGQGAATVIFDLADVRRADARTFATVMILRKACELSGTRRFVLRGTPPRLRDAMRVLGLEHLFDFAAPVHEAVAG